MKDLNPSILPIDSHCHLELRHFNHDRHQVVERARQKLGAIITSAIDTSHYNKAIEISQKYPNFVYTSLGNTPQRNVSIPFQSITHKIESNKNKIVAVGEVGLDYHWVTHPSIRKKQRETFIQWIKFSKKIEKPLIVHSRGAEGDCLEILNQAELDNVYLHCFSGEQTLIKEVKQHKNWFLGVATSVVTRNKTQKIVEHIPMEHMLVETDSPYLSPIKNTSRNEPVFVLEGIETISQIKKIAIQNIIRITTENARNFFSIHK